MPSGSPDSAKPATTGRREKRLEDSRLLRGEARFLSDIPAGDALHAVVLRSPHAHAMVRSIDVAAARAMPGVALVLTGADLEADGIRPIPAFGPPTLTGATVAIAAPAYELLARARVRHVGEPVAFVAAVSEDAALAAAEAIVVDYDPLDAATGPDALGAEPGFAIALGDRAATDAAFARAAHIVEVDVVNQRVAAVPLEPRGAEAAPDGERIVLRTGTQAPHLLRRVLAKDVFGWPEERLRVIVPDTGGGFGAKAPVYREQGLVVWAARRTGRTVRWLSRAARRSSPTPPAATCARTWRWRLPKTDRSLRCARASRPISARIFPISAAYRRISGLRARRRLCDCAIDISS